MTEFRDLPAANVREAKKIQGRAREFVTTTTIANQLNRRRKSSATKVPDKATMSHLDNLMAKFTDAIFEKLEATKDENNAKLDSISTEVKAIREEFASRIGIVERKADKLESENV